MASNGTGQDSNGQVPELIAGQYEVEVGCSQVSEASV